MIRLVVASIASFCAVLPLRAQSSQPSDPGTATIVAANVLIGAITGGVGNVAGGRSFWSGAAKGASGGVFIFAGKEVISRQGSLHAWGGRQLAAIGSSQVRNGAAGRPILSELVFPLWFSRVYVKTSGRPKVSMRFDLSTAVGGAIMASRVTTKFELGQSLRNGVLMFGEEFGQDSVAGEHISGAIQVDRVPAIAPDEAQYRRGAVTAHEIIHAVQYDFVGIALSEPLEAMIFNRSQRGRSFKKVVDPGILTPFWSAANAMIPRNDRPWEREAHALSPGQ